MTTASLATASRHMALRVACAGLRAFFRHAPGRHGKQWLWDRVVRPHILPHSFPIEACTRFGARVEGRLPDPAHGAVYFFGTWQPAVTALFEAALRPGDIAIDVGARAGLHSLLAARLVGPGGRVHAIEASPGIFARLRRNLQANGAFQVIPHNWAVTAAPGRVAVYLRDEVNMAGPILGGGARPAGTVLEAMVHGRPLPDILPEEDLLAARLIRIDAGGAEWPAVRGLAPWLAHLRADVEILVELRRTALEASGGSVEGLVARFAEAGFGAFLVHAHTGGEPCLEQAPPLPAPLAAPLAAPPPDRAVLLFRRPAPTG
jgi:FkbM family methyltransferase